jgi:hypothetical protein
MSPCCFSYRRTSTIVATNMTDPMPTNVMTADARPTTKQQWLKADLKCMTPR